MAESSKCAQCGAVVPGDAPLGLCPNCVLAAGFPTDGGSLAGLESGCDATLAAKFVPPTPEELTPHFPDLEIIELLGRGGMGVVYKARQKRLDRLVALKILAPRIAQDPAFAERFVREARALAMLSHPQIVAVHDFGQTSFPLKLSADEGTSPDGGGEYPLYYFVMEYVDGVNLRRLLETDKISPQQALEIVPQICTALQFAHDAGVVHRDIKPENILLDKQGRVKIADFGIAKLMASEGKGAKGKGSGPDLCEAAEGPAIPEPENLTVAGQVIGTPQYMAPEQIEHPQDVDHRADIYSLGVVFYQMLTGELPTGHFAPPSKKVHIDVRLDEVVLRAMEKEPERRYQQVSEVKTQVENITSTPGADDDCGDGNEHVAMRADARPIVRLFSKLAQHPEWGAKWGAAWVAFAVIFVAPQVMQGHPPRQINGLQMLLWQFSLATPIVVPIIGAISLWKIRHSAGRVSGIGWALFDLLLFPLLALNIAIGWQAYQLVKWHYFPSLLEFIGPGSHVMSEVLFWAFVLIPTLVLSLMIDLPIILWAWRVANRPFDSSQSDVSSPSTSKAGRTPVHFSTPKRPWWYPKWREIFTHTTAAERSAFRKHGVWFGIWNAATLFAPMAIIFFTPIPVPLNWIIAATVLMVGLAFYPLWWKQQTRFLCSSKWARDRNIDPASLYLFPFGNVGLMLVGAALLLFTGVLWWSIYQPPGVWFPYLTETSINKQPGDISLRVTKVSQYKQIVLVTVDCERISDSDELFASVSGPAVEVPDNIVAEMKTVDCLIAPEKDGLGKVLVGTNKLKGKPVLEIGYVLPDEQAAARAVELIRKFYLGQSRGLTEQDSTLPLFALRRRLGKDANGKPVVESIYGSIGLWVKTATIKHIAARPQPSREESDRQGISPSTVSAEPPKLRFLAWQDEMKEWTKGLMWHADGTPVTEKRELRLQTIVLPTLLSVAGNSKLAKEKPRFLNLWFSHPAIDKQSYAEVTLLDAAGKPLPLGASGMLGSKLSVPDPNSDNLGWITYTLSPGRMGNTPKTATIRLRYSVGPWKNGGRIEPDYRGVMSLPGSATLSGIGQNAAGKAFISVAKDIARDPPTQVSFTATSKDGRVLDDPRTTFGGPTAGPVQMRQFESDIPLDQIAEFRYRTRRIKSIEYNNVSLQVEHETDVPTEDI